MDTTCGLTNSVELEGGSLLLQQRQQQPTRFVVDVDTSSSTAGMLLLLLLCAIRILLAVAILTAAAAAIVLVYNGRRIRVVESSFASSVTKKKQPKVSSTADHHQDDEQATRKSDFLQRTDANSYGYRNSPAGCIDTWRAAEFPALIAPTISTTTNMTSTESSSLGNNKCSKDDKDDKDDDERQVYLDYGGAALPGKSQLQHAFQQASSSYILANPHSTGGPAAARTSMLMEQVKKRILDHFQAGPGRLAGLPKHDNRRRSTAVVNDDTTTTVMDTHPGYELVFTSGTTEALRIVAERFPWTLSCCGTCSCQHECSRGQSTLVYPVDSHTSVVGVRGPALAKGARFVAQPVDDLLAQIASDDGVREWETANSSTCCDACAAITATQTTRNLLILPAECNFGGARPNVQAAIEQVHGAAKDNDNNNNNTTSHHSWSTMLDLAKAASTGPVNLQELNPDFACVSFYKMFGAPTGLGCLFVKRSAVNLLMQDSAVDQDNKLRQYFGGGSVDVVLPRVDFGVMRSEPTRLASLANGTAHFRGIVSLQHGFDALDRLGGMPAIQRHTATLATEFVRRMRSLVHANGRPAVVLYGAWQKTPCTERRSDTTGLPGPTIALNLLRDDGTYVGYNEVSKLAALNRPPIQFRTGCFCNPGACQIALGLSDADVLYNYQTAGHVCGDQIDVINGKPTGAIRISFGKDSLWEDLDAFSTFVERLFVSQTGSDSDLTLTARWNGGPRQIILSELYLFPIKSCAAQRVPRWNVNRRTGKLDFDREFALVDSSGIAMRLQAYPRMAFIKPTIDLEKRIMTVSAPSRPDIQLNLDDETDYDNEVGSSIVKVCGNRCGGTLWGDYKASQWFSDYLGVQCWLARHCNGDYQLPTSARPTVSSRSRNVAFANEQPLLLISKHAVDALNAVLVADKQRSVSSRHFRPNMVVRMVGLVVKTEMHEEDGWKRLSVQDKGLNFDVVGQCARCSMVDVDPSTGMKGKTLRALADYRRRNGQITFGIFLRGSGGADESDTAAVDVDHVMVEEGDTLFCQ